MGGLKVTSSPRSRLPSPNPSTRSISDRASLNVIERGVDGGINGGLGPKHIV